MITQEIYVPSEPFVDRILAYLDRLDRNLRCETEIEFPRSSGNTYQCSGKAVACSIETGLNLCAQCASECQGTVQPPTQEESLDEYERRTR